MTKFSVFIFFTFLLVTACNTNKDLQTNTSKEENPAAPGFNVTDSDAEAIALADKIMMKMGGRKNWDDTRYIHWNFFGRRTLLWDKWEGKVRIEIKDDKSIFLVDMRINS